MKGVAAGDEGGFGDRDGVIFAPLGKCGAALNLESLTKARTEDARAVNALKRTRERSAGFVAAMNKKSMARTQSRERGGDFGGVPAQAGSAARHEAVPDR